MRSAKGQRKSGRPCLIFYPGAPQVSRRLGTGYNRGRRDETSGESAMKMILAVIQPTKLDPVQQALARLDVTRMTVADAMGYARQRGQLETYRGHEYKTNLLRKICLEIA